MDFNVSSQNWQKKIIIVFHIAMFSIVFHKYVIVGKISEIINDIRAFKNIDTYLVSDTFYIVNIDVKRWSSGTSSRSSNVKTEYLEGYFKGESSAKAIKIQSNKNDLRFIPCSDSSLERNCVVVERSLLNDKLVLLKDSVKYEFQLIVRYAALWFLMAPIIIISWSVLKNIIG